MNIKATFYIAVYLDGTQVPTISFSNPYQMLGNLATGHLSQSPGVIEELDLIKQVLEGSLNVHAFGGDDWSIIEVEKDTSFITSGFDLFEPIEIPTSEIYKLMNEWKSFLLSYEKNEIPGLHAQNASEN